MSTKVTKPKKQPTVKPRRSIEPTFCGVAAPEPAVDWQARALAAEAQVAALQAELERLRARPATGRPAATAREVAKRKRKRRMTPEELAAALAKTELVDSVCARLSLTRAELAARLDVQQSYLSPSRTLPKRAMERLLEMAKESGK